MVVVGGLSSSPPLQLLSWQITLRHRNRQMWLPWGLIDCKVVGLLKVQLEISVRYARFFFMMVCLPRSTPRSKALPASETKINSIKICLAFFSLSLLPAFFPPVLILSSLFVVCLCLASLSFGVWRVPVTMWFWCVASLHRFWFWRSQPFTREEPTIAKCLFREGL